MQYTQCLSRLCSTHTLPLYTVQYTHSVSLDCAVHTQCLSTLCSAHTVPLYTVQYTHSASLDCAVHTQCLSTLCSAHTHHGQICCHNTDYVHFNEQDRTITVILANHCIKLHDDGPLVIRNMVSKFKYFYYFIIFLILSMNYTHVHLLDNKVF